MDKEKEIQYDWFEISSIIVIAGLITSVIAFL